MYTMWTPTRANAGVTIVILSTMTIQARFNGMSQLMMYIIKL